MSLARFCLRCPHVQPPPYSGPCSCLHDPAAPIDIRERARLRFCPAGKFPLTDEDELEAQGLTPEVAQDLAKRRSCCSPPASTS